MKSSRIVVILTHIHTPHSNAVISVLFIESINDGFENRLDKMKKKSLKSRKCRKMTLKVTLKKCDQQQQQHTILFFKYSSLCYPGQLKKNLKTHATHRLVDIIDTSSLAFYILSLSLLVFFLFISSLKVQIHAFCFL